MVGIASMLRYRATVMRPTDIGPDDYGQPILTDQMIGVDVPCYVWYRSGERSEDETTSMEQYELRAAFLRSADIQSGDKLTSVYDRQENTVFGGLQIDAVMVRQAYLDCVVSEYA
jgi:hypothetical protein